jgi:hypothetical protein
MLVVSFLAYRSPREVLAGSSPASIRRPPHTVITHIPALLMALPVRVGLQHPAHLPFRHRYLPPQTPPARKGNLPELLDASGAGIATSST